MPIVTLTDITLRSLRPVTGKQVTYIDKSLKGFGVRVTGTGAMSYVLTLGRERQRIKIADVGIVTLKDARARAKTLLAEKQLGVGKPTSSPTFDKAKTLFLSMCEQKNKPRTVRDYRRLLSRHFPFGSRPLSEITPQDINRNLDRLLKIVSEQNHALVAAKVFFRWAQRRHYITQSPCEGMQTVRRQPRQRILSDAELAAVYSTGEKIGHPFGTIVQLCILTGQRRSEIAWLRRSYFAKGACTLPAPLTKNKRDHTFPLGKLAQAVIDKLPNDTDLLFPAQRGHTVFGGWSKCKTGFDKACPIEPWTLHDLRRTFATNLAALDTPIHVTERLLNHISGSTTGGLVAVYQRHNFWDHQVAAIDAWENHLASLLAEPRPCQLTPE